MRVAQEIARQPANGKGLKLSVLVFPCGEARRQLGLLIIRQDANDRNKRMRKFRIVAGVLIGKRNDKTAIVRIGAFTQASRDFGFDAIYDLRVQRQIIA